MQRYDVRYVSIAEEDLCEIVEYLLEHSAKAANEFIDELEKLEETLSMFPKSAVLIRDRRLRSKNYRMMVVKEYLLFYTLRNKDVYVMRIIHNKRDYLALLQHMQSHFKGDMSCE